MDKNERSFERLVEIMALLRSDNGCPWDREQDHKSIRQHLLEEAYEVIETIDDEKYDDLPAELGDLLLQVIFHAQIADEAKRFNIYDVIENINEKLIRRHPHIFGDEVVESADEQVSLWEQTKVKKEGKKSAIDGVPNQLPALVRAYRIQNKAAAVGFDWQSIEPVWSKVAEEIKELEEVVEEGDKDRIEDELGDMLFSIVNVSRFLKVNPEDALRRAINKFDNRFRKVEADFKERGVALTDSTLEEMDAVWDKVKKEEN